MWVSELFYSIQGEGILTGVPSAFVRTTGCNLRCAWCDSPYTSWDPEG
jgi:7-carboxy-7-deazaguanine synthase